MFIFLGIEFLDELVFGLGEAAWPLARDDLSLSYTQIGLLLAVPALASSMLAKAGNRWFNYSFGIRISGRAR